MKNKYIASVCFCVSLLLNGCGFFRNGTDAKVPLVGIREKKVDFDTLGPNDNKKYMYLKLDNGLRVMLVSDPSAVKSNVNMKVVVGSSDEPDEYLGLAHFLEHMLFIGSDKYPKVDSFMTYVEKYGGFSNASTGSNTTNYYFTINNEQLESALDRYAQFFLTPKLEAKYVDLERNAVHSEYQGHFNGWFRPVYQVLNTLSNKIPSTRFSVGSLTTLHNEDKKTLLKALKKFFKKHYIGPNMHLAVYGKESLENLKKMVQQKFYGLNKGAGKESHTAYHSRVKKVYSSDQLSIRVNIIPKTDVRMLILEFYPPSIDSNAMQLVSTLMLSKNSGGLLQFLRDKKLVTDLYLEEDSKKVYMFAALTKKGLKNIDDVTAYVMDYLYTIKHEGINRWFFKQLTLLKKLNFLQSEPMDPLNTIFALSTPISTSIMRILPLGAFAEIFLNSDRVDISQIYQFLDDLSPSVLRQIVISKDLPVDKVEPYYQSKYSVQPLSKELVSRLNHPSKQVGFSMPNKDRFLEYIPSTLKLQKSDVSDKPTKIMNEKGLNVWRLTDTQYKVAKGNIVLQLTSEYANGTTKKASSLMLYVGMLQFYLDHLPISIAKDMNLNFSLQEIDTGIEIFLSGYDNKQPLLLKQILEAIKQFKPTQKLFDLVKNERISQIDAALTGDPSSEMVSLLQQYLVLGTSTKKDYKKTLQSLSLSNVEQFIANLYQSIHVDMLVYGNFSHPVAIKIAELVKSSLLSSSNQADRYYLPIKKLSSKLVSLKEKFDSPDFVSLRYVQGDRTLKSRASFDLLSSILKMLFFSSLRTEQQLGYMVRLSSYSIGDYSGLLMIVQSKFKGDLLDKRIDDFVKKTALNKLNNLTNIEFNEYRDAYVKRLLEKIKYPEQKFNQLWNVIDSRVKKFNDKKMLAHEAEQLTKEDLQDLWKIINSGAKQVMISTFK